LVATNKILHNTEHYSKLQIKLHGSVYVKLVMKR
jgi:hypothetical protein